jgi:hypothetical protein
MILEIKHDEDENKFYIIVNGSEAYLRYIMVDNDTMEIVQTYVPNELRNRGIAGEIVRGCLSFAEEKKLRIIPTCSFAEAFIKRHKEFENLLA